MRIQTMTADTNGTIEVGGGYGICLVPKGKGARLPVTLQLGRLPERLPLEEVRPLYPGPFPSITITGAVAKSEWLVYVAETEKEVIGTASGALPMERIARIRSTTTIAAGAWYLNATTGALTDTITFYDVRRYRGVVFSITATQGNAAQIESGTPTAKGFLWLFDGNNNDPSSPDCDVGLAPYCELPIGGSDNDLLSFATLRAHVGETVQTDLTGSNIAYFRDRPAFVVPRITVSGGTISYNGLGVFDLWGVP